ncbi:hypothetical protein D3C78_1307880 [compost metagenome]
MADYYLKSIYRMLLNNMKNSPTAARPDDLRRIIHHPMITDSAKKIGLLYACGSWKEYIYILALKFRLTGLLFRLEFKGR